MITGPTWLLGCPKGCKAGYINLTCTKHITESLSLVLKSLPLYPKKISSDYTSPPATSTSTEVNIT